MEDLINKQSEIINKQIELLYSITDTTKIIWKIEDVKYSNDLSSMSKQYVVVGYKLAVRFRYYGNSFRFVIMIKAFHG